jgi:hypothetical protein
MRQAAEAKGAARQCLPPAHRLSTWIAIPLVCWLAGLPAHADEITIEDGARFAVHSAYLEPVQGVLHLKATLDLALSRSALQAIKNGVAVSLELDFAVERPRRYFFPSESIAHVVQRWQIHYHALSQRYLVNNLNTGQQATYATLEAALGELAQLRGLPVLDEALLNKGRRYEASLRIVSSVDSGLPDALRKMMFWVDWKRVSDWYTWTVQV